MGFALSLGRRYYSRGLSSAVIYLKLRSAVSYEELKVKLERDDYSDPMGKMMECCALAQVPISELPFGVSARILSIQFIDKSRLLNFFQQ